MAQSVQITEIFGSAGDDRANMAEVTDMLVHDGGLVVLSASERRALVLSQEGQLLDTWGREGEGPGEFQRPMKVGRNGRRDAASGRDGAQRGCARHPARWHSVSSLRVDP